LYEKLVELPGRTFHMEALDILTNDEHGIVLMGT
jgi:hypothetical protein